jgi:hypothetical protein
VYNGWANAQRFALPVYDAPCIAMPILFGYFPETKKLYVKSALPFERACTSPHVLSDNVRATGTLSIVRDDVIAPTCGSTCGTCYLFR